jgi:hypothetical protein
MPESDHTPAPRPTRWEDMATVTELPALRRALQLRYPGITRGNV